MAEVNKCPEGMVLINTGGKVQPDEPAFCIERTQVTQAADRAFWAERQKSGYGYELVVTKKDGSTARERNPQERPLKTQAAARIQQDDVSGVQVKPVVVKDKPQPDGNSVGDKKAAILRTWDEAEEYCATQYLGGHLPTNRQWEKACGDKGYCESSGELKASEAVYDISIYEQLANVDASPPNANGVQGMNGDVWEWTRDDAVDGSKFIRGGEPFNVLPWYQRALISAFLLGVPVFDVSYVAFRCIASPQDSSEK